MPLVPPPSGSGSGTTGSLLGALGLMATNPSAVPSGYTASGYTTANKTMPAYTSTPTNTAYVGGLLDLLQAARLADLNTLRAAHESVRVLAEATAQQVNALKADLKDIGIIAS